MTARMPYDFRGDLQWVQDWYVRLGLPACRNLSRIFQPGCDPPIALRDGQMRLKVPGTVKIVRRRVVPHQVGAPTHIQPDMRLRQNGLHRFEIGTASVHVIGECKTGISGLEPRGRTGTEYNITKGKSRGDLTR